MNEVYQLRVELLNSHPSIWRRIQVPASITLPELHGVIQTVMGWEDYHLHRFEVEGRRYTVLDEDALEDDFDEKGQRLDQLLPKVGQSFFYEYDFGDSWEHRITVEAIEPSNSPLSYPICLEGERACPPEDCGGIWQYNETREAYTDPRHKDHAELVEWLGYTFDPDGFDRNVVNRALRGDAWTS